ncbi:zona pellucida-like domain-containing protein 1 [Megalops cyprinoides]|uniref:zona pellucida-like domain-containing protein 1 n=1 Tax=Megalops cyprinoides TaxID=118141 RepID=UPI0018648749|nr:zona pellucida-like domain-containing protein 1 [Megalops cyprinoides]
MLSLCLPMVAVLLQLQLGNSALYNCSSAYERIPDNSDLVVDCGTNLISLEVNLCTAQWAGFEPAGLALNGQHNNSLCKGAIDTSVDPPVIRYQLPVNSSQENPCRQSLQIVDGSPGPGIFSSFSSIQSMIITGFIDTPRSSEGLISYSTDLFYRFSCRYPLEYLLNNTRIMATSVSVATTGNNGSFISALSMNMYNDTDYSHPLVVPETGLALRTKIYVEVKATNLTGNFHVLLDRCFATPSPFNVSSSEQHDFFIGCNIDPRTTVEQNGAAANARFLFEAFRFVEHHNQDMSSLFLHCIVRLCEPSKCQELLGVCSRKRRRRDLEPFGSEASDSTMVSVGPIYTTDTGGGQQAADPSGVTGLAVGMTMVSAGTAMLVLGGWAVLKKLHWGTNLLHTFS